MKTQIAALAAATLICIAGTSKADNLRVGIHIGNTSYLAAKFLPLAGTATTVTFTVPTAGLVAVTFNAKCNVEGAEDSYSDLGVFIDGIAVNPTNGAFDVFCSTYNGLNRATLTVAKVLAAGNHNVRIRAATFNSATSAFIGDSTLLITR